MNGFCSRWVSNIRNQTTTMVRYRTNIYVCECELSLEKKSRNQKKNYVVRVWVEEKIDHERKGYGFSVSSVTIISILLLVFFTFVVTRYACFPMALIFSWTLFFIWSCAYFCVAIHVTSWALAVRTRPSRVPGMCIVFSIDIISRVFGRQLIAHGDVCVHVHSWWPSLICLPYYHFSARNNTKRYVSCLPQA